MRFISLALFIFFIQISFAIINTTMIFDTSINPKSDFFTEIDLDSLQNTSYVSSDVQSDNLQGGGDFIKSLWYFIGSFGHALYSTPYLLSQFGVVAPFTYYFGLPIYLLYLLAFIQIIGNRSFRGMR